MVTWTFLAIRDLLRPEAFRHAVSEITLRETHLSWVVLTGQFAYKIKKPVKLGFLDASTVERRRHYCEEELRLNRRFAPDLHLDVLAITRDGEAFLSCLFVDLLDREVSVRIFVDFLRFQRRRLR